MATEHSTLFCVRTRRERCPELPLDVPAVDNARWRLCGGTLSVVENAGAADAREVLERLGPRAVLSHHDAARVLGIELAVDDGSRHVTVPRNCGRPREAGWWVHRADVHAVTTRDGLRVTSEVRAVGDLARVLPLAEAVAAGDSVLRQGLADIHLLVPALVSAHGPASGRLHAVAAHLDPLSGSVLESLGRVLFHEHGLPVPQTQHAVRDERGRLVARVDFAWPGRRLVVELDGRAFHSDLAVQRADRLRQNELERLGWTVVRLSWEDVVHRPLYAVQLVRDCLALAAVA